MRLLYRRTNPDVFIQLGYFVDFSPIAWAWPRPFDAIVLLADHVAAGVPSL